MRPTRSCRSQALVVGSMRLGEADRIVHLYTRDRGLVSAVAKGVRKTLSRTGGRLEPFCLVDVMLYEGRTLYTVTSVDTIRPFAGIRESLFRIEAGGRTLQVVRRMLPEEERNPAAFNLMVRYLAVLGETRSATEAGSVTVAAWLKLLLTLGCMPPLHTCCRCGSVGSPAALDEREGAFLCRECAGDNALRWISPEAAGCIESLLQRPLSEACGVSTSPEALFEAEHVVSRLIETSVPG